MRGGIAVESLGLSQLSISLTNEINQIDKLDEYWDIIIFYHVYDRVLIPPKFAMLQEQELWSFDAPVMSTNLVTTQRLINCPRPNKKYFYVYDLEWMFNHYNIEIIAPIYMNKDINLVARSEEHANIISKCWKDPVDVIEDFKYERIIELFKR